MACAKRGIGAAISYKARKRSLSQTPGKKKRKSCFYPTRQPARLPLCTRSSLALYPRALRSRSSYTLAPTLPLRATPAARCRSLPIAQALASCAAHQGATRTSAAR